MGRKLTTSELLEKFRVVHGNKYDYSSVKYSGYMEKVTIICREHGAFSQTPDKHIHGRGCAACYDDSLRLSIVDFVKQARKVHGDTYEYSKVVYERRNKQVVIVCKYHGDFLQTPHNHILGRGCKDCFYASKVRRYRRKPYYLNGKRVMVQGFEPFALDYLQTEKKVAAADLALGKRVPTVKYFDTATNKMRNHIPDIYIKSQNRIVEVKSTYTFEYGKAQLVLKRQAAISAGFKYSVLVMNKDGTRHPLKKNWFKEAA